MVDIESKCTVKVNSGQLSVKLNGHSRQMERSESIKVQKLTVKNLRVKISGLKV